MQQLDKKLRLIYLCVSCSFRRCVESRMHWASEQRLLLFLRNTAPRFWRPLRCKAQRCKCKPRPRLWTENSVGVPLLGSQCRPGARDPGGAGLPSVKSSGHAFHLHSIKKLTYFTVLLSINMGHAGSQLLPLLSLYSSLLPFLIFTPFRHMHMVLIFPCNSLLARLDIFSHLLLPHFLHVWGLPWIGF